MTVPLGADGTCPVLTGLRDPFQAESITAGMWQRLSALLAGQRCDVIADAGQLRSAGFPFSLLDVASLIVMVVRPTTRQVAAAQPRVAALREAFGPSKPLGLCVIGRGH